MGTKSTPGDAIKAMPIGKFLNLGKIAPSGSLEARRLVSGPVAIYWRSTINGKSYRVPIGNYDASAPPKSLKPTARGFSLAAAERAAEDLAQQHDANKAAGGYPALVAAENDAQRHAAEMKLEALRHTLKNLLGHYCDHLQVLGRVAHRDARSIFKIHVFEAWPQVAELPASQVTSEQIADMMRRVLDLGKGRTANKLRSYVRAAYQVARAARSKASIPLHFKSYGVIYNPAADTEPDETANKADKNPLSRAELRGYWQAIRRQPGFKGAVLRVHMLTGGQRIEQLVRLLTADAADIAITLYDAKGRPGKPPRAHTLPLIEPAAAALKACNSQGAYALSTDAGATHLAATTLSAWAAEAGADIPGFQAKRIRSGIETLLASLGVSMEIRGRLQSHGVAGVQNRHYDAHDYLAVKRTALQSLYNALERKEGSTVVPIKAGRIRQALRA